MTSLPGTSKNIFIYGSCVTRDAMEFMPPSITLNGYVARQSLISACNPCNPKDFDFASIKSAFQRRMYELDVSGGAMRKILMHGAESDLILWDITDERLGVVQVQSSGYVTRNVNHVNAGHYKGAHKFGRILEFGNDDHFKIWEDSCRSVLDDLTNSGLFPKVRVMHTEWAEVDDLGNTLEAGLVFNQAAQRYYDVLEESGLEQIITPAALSAGKSTHKWGMAPFHFTDATYMHIVGELERLFAGTTASAPA